MFQTTDHIDNVVKRIPMGIWRGYCLGMDADGKPKGSNSTWAQYKRDTGYSIHGVTEPRDKFITERAAYKLFIRSRIDEICKLMEVDRPEKLGPMALEEIADKAIPVMKLGSWDDMITKLFKHYENEDTRYLDVNVEVDPTLIMDSEGLDAFLVTWLGKSVPLTTKRRKCKKANIKYSTKKTSRFHRHDAMKIVEVLSN